MTCLKEQQYEEETNAQSLWRLSHGLLRMAGTLRLLTTRHFTHHQALHFYHNKKSNADLIVLPITGNKHNLLLLQGFRWSHHFVTVHNRNQLIA